MFMALILAMRKCRTCSVHCKVQHSVHSAISELSCKLPSSPIKSAMKGLLGMLADLEGSWPNEKPDNVAPAINRTSRVAGLRSWADRAKELCLQLGFCRV